MTPNTAPAVLQLLSNCQMKQRGKIHAGGKLVIEYDMKRMPGIGRWFRDAVDGDIDVYVKFHPGEVMSSGKVLKKIQGNESRGSGPVVGLEPVLYEVIVPTNAHQVEVWFKGSTRSSVTWDSQYGQNYCFPVEDESQPHEGKP